MLDLSREAMIKKARRMLARLGDGDISASAYDTAWVARIPNKRDFNRPMFPECLEWICNNQLADGSWGSPNIEYVFDRLLCTMSAIIALKKWNVEERLIKRGEDYVNRNLNKLKTNKHATVGFELLFLELIKTAKQLGLRLQYDNTDLKKIQFLRKKKLEKITIEYVYEKHSTLLHSLEGLGQKIDFRKVLKLQSSNGSFLNSPASTAFVYINTNDQKSLDYILEILKRYKNYLPVNHPLDIFERLWVLNEIYEKGLQEIFARSIKSHIKYIKNFFSAKGISWSQYVEIPDLDDTAVAYKILKAEGAECSSSIFENFLFNNSFSCFYGEVDASISHLAHLLSALSEENPKDRKYAKIAVRQINNILKVRGLSDKWSLSESYVLQELQRVPSYFRKNLILPKRKARYSKKFNQAENHWIDKVLYKPILLDELIYIINKIHDSKS